MTDLFTPRAVPVFFPILLSFLVIPLPSRPDVTLELSGTLKPLHYPHCDKIDLEKETYVSCMCFEGVWALLLSVTSAANNEPSHSQWKIVGSSTDSNTKCLHLGQWVRRLKKISNTSNSSKITRLQDNSNIFVLTNSQDWEIQIVSQEFDNFDGNENERKKVAKYCLPGSLPSSYCLYNMNTIKIDNENGLISEKDFYPNCTKGSRTLIPTECQAFEPSVFEKYEDGKSNFHFDFDFEQNAHHPFVCSIIPSRRKRQAKFPAPANASSKEIDEDYITPENLVNYKGEDTMMNSISDYMLTQITNLLDLNQGRTKREIFELPVTKLLRLSGDIMKKICGAISETVFTIAMESFIIQQRTVYQLKEPYISYAPYRRILHSLEKCLGEAAPYRFLQNKTNPDNVTCEAQIPSITTAFVFDASNVADVTREIPYYAASDPNSFEPIIEIAWKMFVNAHSFCFKHFTDYYNDHHTYTVSIMPFFTNQIQDIWFLRNETLNGTDISALNSSGSINYTTPNIWYGNLLGDLSKLYLDLDHCYSATRKLHEEYPWFLNRPPRDFTNEWTRRRKRDIFEDPEEMEDKETEPVIQMPCE